MIRVLIADDHPVVRAGVRQIVSTAGDITVAAEAATGHEVIAQVRGTPLDLVVLDLSMSDGDGLDVLKQIKREHPGVRVIVLTMHSEHQFAIRALKAGAAGYVTKDSAPAELVTAIRHVMDGGRYVTLGLAEKLAAHIGREGEQVPHEELSDREYQVLRLIAAGRSTREIADQLSLSMKTISTYRSRILEKMQMRNVAELTAYVVRNRLAD